MKVYVLVEVWQMDSGDCGQDIRVFSNIESAKKVFEEKIVEAKQDMARFETEDILFNGNMNWSIWEKDEYCYNHIDLAIIEREVE